MWKSWKVPIVVQASLVLLSAQLFFSGWHILGSVSFHAGADPLIFCLYRNILGTTLMHVYIRLCGMKINVEPVDYQRFLFLGTLSFISSILAASALKFIAPSRFSITQPIVPCVSTALSMFLGLEQMGAIKILGVSVAVIGAFLAEGSKQHQAEENQHHELNVHLGTAIAVAQVIVMGTLLVVLKPLVNKYPPEVVSCVYFSIATVATLLLCLARIDIFVPEDFYFRGETLPWVTLVYASVFTTMYAFTALSWGGKYFNPSAATVFFTFQPVGTIILSATILHAVVTLPEILGVLLIMTGLTITALYVENTGAGENAISRHIEDDNNDIAHKMRGGTTTMAIETNEIPPQKSVQQTTVSSAIELVKSAFRGAKRNPQHQADGVSYSQLQTEDWQPTDVENSGSSSEEEEDSTSRKGDVSVSLFTATETTNCEGPDK